MAITKIGNKLEEYKPYAGGAATVAGGEAVRRSTRDGHLTGRETLYHGTTPEARSSILREGLRATTDDSAINTRVLKDSKPGVYREALGKSYLTRSPMEAREYSLGNVSRSGKQLNPDDAFRLGIKGEGVVKGRVPLWKMKTVRNPETAMGYARWKKESVDPVYRALAPDRKIRKIYDKLDRAVVVEGDVPSNYLKGGKNYQRAGLREVSDFIKNNRLRALRGYGISGLGIGAGALGTKTIYDSITEK